MIQYFIYTLNKAVISWQINGCRADKGSMVTVHASLGSFLTHLHACHIRPLVRCILINAVHPQDAIKPMDSGVSLLGYEGRSADSEQTTTKRVESLAVKQIKLVTVPVLLL